MTATAYLGLGGNLGDPAATMAAALRAIDAREDTSVSAVSRALQHAALGQDRPARLRQRLRRGADHARPPRTPGALPRHGAGVQARAPRALGPRTLDLDVLDYDGRAYRDDDLVLPHPRIAERAFVLVPLAEIAPDLVIGGRGVAELLAAVDRAGIDPASADGGWWQARADG